MDAEALQKEHARHLQIWQWASLYSREHHGWHCSSLVSPSMVDVHAQNPHALHLQSPQCESLNSARQKDAQSMKLLSSACSELQAGVELSSDVEVGSTAVPLEGAHHEQPWHRHQEQCSVRKAGEHHPKQLAEMESSSCDEVQEATWAVVVCSVSSSTTSAI